MTILLFVVTNCGGLRYHVPHHVTRRPSSGPCPVGTVHTSHVTLKVSNIGISPDSQGCRSLVTIKIQLLLIIAYMVDCLTEEYAVYFHYYSAPSAAQWTILSPAHCSGSSNRAPI